MSRIGFASGMDANQFLEKYWQKKPLLIRGALNVDRFSLSPEELAGLALEEDVEGRLVLQAPNGALSLVESPFATSDFTDLPTTGWTLLVQDVDKHLPELAAFLDHFDFIPSWRLDDLMISVAAPGGGVGPHVDQYDVFLCQVSGHRRWKLGTAGGHTELDGTALRQIAPFRVAETVLLAPGDVLYLPPGIPHDGVAEDLCSTWSVGFRAPSKAELAEFMPGESAPAADASTRYQDPDLRADEAVHGLIGESAIARFRELVGGLASLGDEEFIVSLGQFLTTPKPWLAPQACDAPVTENFMQQKLRAGEQLYRHGMALFARASHAGRHWLFSSGQSRPAGGHLGALVQILCAHRQIAPEELSALHSDPDAIALLTCLYNDGQLLLESDLDEIPGQGS